MAPRSSSKPAGATRSRSTAKKAEQNRSVVTGANGAFYRTKDGVTHFAEEGEKLPVAKIDDDELDRLDEAGVFGDHPRVAYRSHLARLQAMGLATNLPDDVERSQVELDAAVGGAGDDSPVGEPHTPSSPEAPPKRDPSTAHAGAETGHGSAQPSDAAAARAAAMGDDAGKSE